MIVLRNEYIEASIAERGAELCSLKDLENGRELIWEGRPEFWSYHAPVLFPFVGALNGKQYRYRGKTYQMGQHGFAREKTFRIVRQTNDLAVHVLESDEQTREIYPFDFRLQITQKLEGRSLNVGWEVVNPSETETLFFSIGAHPAFRVPCREDSRKNECFVRFPGKETLTYILKASDADAAVPSRQYTMRLDDGYLKIEDHLFDIDTFIFEDGQIREVSLCGADRKPYVTMTCDGFPYFGLWTKSDTAPFVCLEPWFGRLDDKDFSGELPEKTGIRSLKPGEVFRADYQITV